MKICETCDLQSVKGERFCKHCKKAHLDQMRKAGYLKATPSHGNNRNSEQKENVYETKNGVWE